MSIEETLCPICNGPMASRANKDTGQRFWGCKRFPVCKGTRNTDGEAKSADYREQLDGEEELPSSRRRGFDRERWRNQ
jgi:ssDNA-binding Zn-finger/Zn-ribbon topoisomerase 1